MVTLPDKHEDELAFIEKIRESNIENLMYHSPPNSLNRKIILEEVLKAINKSKKNNVPDIGSLSYEIFKNDISAKALIVFFNRCLSWGMIPFAAPKPTPFTKVLAVIRGSG